MADLIIKDFNKGIGNDPNTGFQYMEKVNVDNGGVELSYITQRNSYPDFAITFIANTTTNIISHQFIQDGSGSGLGSNGNVSRAVQFTTTGTLPAGLSLSTTYWIDNESNGTSSYVYPTLADSITDTNVIDITTTGTGVHTMTAIPFGVPTGYAYDPRTGLVYVSDSSNRIWTNRASGSMTFHLLTTATGGTITGLIVYKDYLFIFQYSYISVWGVLTADISAQSMKSTSWLAITGIIGMRDIIIGKDDIMYFTNDRYIGSIKENVGTFDPATPSTYTATQSALDFPVYTSTVSLSELGKYLYIGTNNGLYPWDRTSTSFNMPVTDKAIKGTIEYNNLLYFFSGKYGSLYVTNGTTIQLIKKMPVHLFPYNITGVGMSVATNALFIKDDKLYFFPTGFAVSEGFYSYNFTTGAIVNEFSLSQQTNVGNGYTSIAFVLPWSNTFVIGYTVYKSPSTPAVDVIAYPTAKRFGNYEANIITPLYKISSELDKSKIAHIEVNLERPLNYGSSAGQGIRLSYRADTSSSFSSIATIDSTMGNSHSYTIPFAINEDQLQLKIELTTYFPDSPNTSQDYSPKITSIRLY